jgi:hypothetical protein
MDLTERYPDVSPEHRPRPLYFAHDISVLDRMVLEQRGYVPIATSSMPRRTDAEQQAYLLGRAQGLEEGTIHLSEEQTEALELQMKSYGLMNTKSTVMRLNVTVTDKGIAQVLDWQRSRHTLHDNTTVVGLSDLLLHGETTSENKADGVKHLEAMLSDSHRKKLESIKTMRRKEEEAGKAAGKLALKKGLKK